ncbi:MAG: LPS export ABC transporter periplasmic protein LptC [Candidatus Firestonebacteria bacterium]
MRTLLVVILAAALLFLSSCGRETTKIITDLPKGIISMKGFELKQTLDGKVILIIKADEAQIFHRENYTRFYGVKARYFEKEKETSNLTSKEGTINNATNDVVVTGNVVLKTREGAILETEKLIWSNKTNRLSSNMFVKITKGSNTMTGIGLESDMMLENITMKKVLTKITDLDEFKKRK